jgi:PAS domain S-box-containing protein
MKGKGNNPLKILLLEDNEYDKSSFELAFQESDVDCQINWFIHAEEALTEIESNFGMYDIVVTDFRLPGMSGLEFCKVLIEKEIPLPTLMLTGEGSEHLAVKALKAGVNDYVIKDFEGYYLEILPIRIPEIVRSYQDRLARESAENALKQSEEKFRLLFEEAPIGIAINRKSENSEKLDVNSTLADFLGYSIDELEAMGSREMARRISNPDKFPKEKIFIQQMLAGKISSYQMEKEYLKKNGEIVCGELKVAALFDENNTMRQTIFIVQDVTERKKAQKRIQQYLEELKELNATKDKFFSIIAHDLKNPLNVITGYSESLEEIKSTFSEERVRKAVSRIYNSAVNLDKLLENLLEWSRMQIGKKEFVPRTLKLNHVINDNVVLLSGMANSKEIELTSDVKEDLSVIADHNMLKTVLRNLITNALKFTPRGGNVTISAKDRGDCVEVSVMDTGIGISQENQKKLFRIDAPYGTPGTEQEMGTGLGLILCREFIKKHHGKIWVESEIDKGSTFTFTLPKE